MRRIPVSRLEPGMVLARTVYAKRGEVLLRSGAVLTERYIRTLQARGFYSVWVRSGIADDIEPEEAVPETVRLAAHRHLYDLFALARRTGLQSNSYREVLVTFVDQAAPLMVQLHRDVESMVDAILNIEVLSSLTATKGHDEYFFEHAIEVAVAAVVLGRRVYLPLDYLRQLALGCLLHDIGILLVPVEILNKPGRLSSAEYTIVQKHPSIGYEVMRRLVSDSKLVACHVVWQHHERQDGFGYPRRLRGTNTVQRSGIARFEPGRIILGAEIAAVADVYSALASDRPYRQALEPISLRSSLEAMAGTHLNRELVYKFLSLIPMFPVGTEVVLNSGALRGYSGIVVEINPGALNNPRVRLLFDPYGRAIAPFEVDTSREDVVLSAISIAQTKG